MAIDQGISRPVEISITSVAVISLNDRSNPSAKVCTTRFDVAVQIRVGQVLESGILKGAARRPSGFNIEYARACLKVADDHVHQCCMSARRETDGGCPMQCPIGLRSNRLAQGDAKAL